ncbi:cation diffusion facilitator family transporter [Stutzerimonas kunmingensis]|uniref:cation diffusion facilitator family transporter n=1 Tax=Stutzerimonas kunmingensis TaxID=1211807 RepID=UPI002103897F|nr:cation diffusion facilitator family transporter [Stutzerimonas kunmingensis]MCQ2036316.1 cation diffusion facilitator family transporter [Stutzerimonas kunmingensis]
MAHDHDQHAHNPRQFNRAFAIGIVLNLAFVVTEAFYGWQVNSLALLADAGHNLSDVGGLILAWAAMAATRLQPNDRHTYGWRRGSILASFINALILLVAMGSLGWESIQRLQAPVAIVGETVMLVAAVGVLVNSITAWLFFSGSRSDLNLRGAFLHMAADALVSIGVVLAGALYLWQGWGWIDPLVSLAIAIVIVLGTWSLFRQSLHLLFDGVPEQVDLPAVRQYLLGQANVCDVHDLHVWAMSTADVALTAHMAMTALPEDDEFLQAVARELHERFGIAHATLQLERDPGCPLSCSTPRVP